MSAFVSKLSPEQWAEARSLRAEGTSYGKIAARFGITATTVGQRARKEGWPTSKAAGAKPANPKARIASPATAEVRRDLAHRLYRLIGIQIQMLELRMTKELEAQQKALDAGEIPPPIEDRSETFAALIEQINHVTEMASEPASAADGRRKSANPELTALYGEIDAAGLAAASAKDESTARLADQLAKVVGPA